MTKESAHKKIKSAKEYQKNGNYAEAANRYTSAGYEYLGENGLVHSATAAYGLKSLLVAAACLRFQGKQDKYQTLCWQGVYISKALAEEALSRPPASHPHDQAERVVYTEFEGDFRIVGKLSGSEETYNHARELYQGAGNPNCVSCEQILGAVAYLPKILYRGTSLETTQLEDVLKPETTLTEWIDFKQQRLSFALERLEEEAEWTYVF